jgi:type II secretory pathway component PulJ
MRSRRCFTLLEVLLALGLIATLSGGIFAFLWNVMERRDALLSSVADAQSAGSLLELLEADIACVVAGDAAAGAGIRGDAHTLRLLSRRVWAPGAYEERTASMGDLQGTEYSYQPGSGMLSVQRWPAAGAGPGGGADVICERLEAFRLRYFDGHAWMESFDSLQQGGLPVALEVAVWFGQAGGLPAAEGDDEPAPIPQRAPDRFRIICIPDGPTMWWKEAR